MKLCDIFKQFNGTLCKHRGKNGEKSGEEMYCIYKILHKNIEVRDREYGIGFSVSNFV